jgi:predicted TIM-barrel fold metal-dependent hydrolase
MQVDADYAMALARAYNAWQFKKWLKTEGFYGAICTAPQDPESSADEIAKWASNGKMRCVYLPAAAVNPLYGNRKYDPIYEAAEGAGLPVVLHGLAVCHPVFPCQVEQFNEIGRHAFGHSLEMVANMVSMMSTGVLERFPDLKIGFMEGGIAWVPWIMMRLNNEYFEWKGRLLPFLKEPPSSYFRKNIFYATQPIEEPANPGDYMKILDLIGGADNVLFASDWPHHDFDSPRKLLSYPLPLDVKRKIMGENAVRFFGLPRGT